MTPIIAEAIALLLFIKSKLSEYLRKIFLSQKPEHTHLCHSAYIFTHFLYKNTKYLPDHDTHKEWVHRVFSNINYEYVRTLPRSQGLAYRQLVCVCTQIGWRSGGLFWNARALRTHRLRETHTLCVSLHSRNDKKIVYWIEYLSLKNALFHAVTVFSSFFSRFHVNFRIR